jgi:predicted transcriptional regulator
MKAYTLKLPEEKARALKHIAVEEDRTATGRLYRHDEIGEATSNRSDRRFKISFGTGS